MLKIIHWLINIWHIDNWSAKYTFGFLFVNVWWLLQFFFGQKVCHKDLVEFYPVFWGRFFFHVLAWINCWSWVYCLFYTINEQYPHNPLCNFFALKITETWQKLIHWTNDFQGCCNWEGTSTSHALPHQPPPPLSSSFLNYTINA